MEKNLMYVKPVEGRRVKDPKTFKLVENARYVEKNQYWMRRLLDGDIVKIDKSKKREEPKIVKADEPVLSSFKSESKRESKPRSRSKKS